MDKYEFNIKVEQIKKLVSRGDYDTAMKIADTIDWHRVRNASLLSMIAQIYEKNEEYQEAKDILLLAFERAPVGKRLLYKLSDLALKEGNIQEAEAYYREFCDMAQDDPRQYLLRYLILKAKKAPVDQLIRALETYTTIEVDEKWIYELAELYHAAGNRDACVRTCDKIMLLFGLGKYVDKAMDLKLKYAPLTKYQMDLVENRDKYEAKLRAVEEEYAGQAPVYQEDYEEKLGAEVTHITQEKEARISVEVEPEEEEGELEATRPLTDLQAIRESRYAKPVSDVVTEEKNEEAARELVGHRRNLEIQRQAIRAAREREELEEEAIRRIEAEREAAIKAEEERRAKKQAEIDRKRAQRQPIQVTLEDEYEEAREPEQEPESVEEFQYNHLMIEAKTPEEGLSLALEALRKLHRELGDKNPVAKIDSTRLNARGISAVAEKLAGKDLIIENAASLTNTVQNELNALMEYDDSGMIVVLIDTPANMEALHANNASLAGKFQYIGTDEPAANARATEAAVEAALKRDAEAQERLMRTMAVVAAPKFPDEETTDSEDVGGYDEASDDDEAEDYEEKMPEDAGSDMYEEEYEDESDEYESESDEYEDESDEYEDESDDEEESEDDVGDGTPAPAVAYDNKIELSSDEFAKFCCKYASEIDCVISGKSLLALYERIEMMEEDGEPLTKRAAANLIEEAADKAEKPSLGKKLTGLFSPKYDKDGLLILREDNFFD